MKTHDNTLYVTTQGAYLAVEGDNLLVKVEGEIKLRLPIHTIGGVVCFGRVSMSPFAMGLCGQSAVAVSFLTTNGRFLARLEGPASGNVLLRREQYRRADLPDATAEIARNIIAAKIANARTVLLRGLRDHDFPPAREQVRRAVREMAGLLDRLQHPLPLDQLRGTEGEGARLYFGVFDHLLTAEKDCFQFRTRTRRPPRDPINALLSFLYALLAHDTRSACEAVGLDPQVGFLHRDRPGRPGLALDLMEELRPVLADRLALTLVNRRQVKPDGFTAKPAGGVEMNDKTRKTVLVAYQKRKAEEIIHPFLGEKITVGLMPHVQARLLARHLRNDLDTYPPFFWR